MEEAATTAIFLPRLKVVGTGRIEGAVVKALEEQTEAAANTTMIIFPTAMYRDIQKIGYRATAPPLGPQFRHRLFASLASRTHRGRIERLRR